MEYFHKSIMVEEVIEGLIIKEDGIYVDGTLGGGGHSFEIVKRLNEGRLIGIDQDMNAIKGAKERLKGYKDKITIVHDNYLNIEEILNKLNIEKVDGILLDLGVSSHQLDEGERGFSFHQDAPLDMRMNREEDFTAWNVVNEYDDKKLEKILWDYGEEKWASRIAKFIVEERKIKTIDTTMELVTVIKKAIPKGARNDGQHPARKTFQGIRVEVNKELEIIKEVLPKMARLLKRGGRICIIDFHSLEDRIVKNVFKELNKECICPPDFPICICDKKKEINIITKKPIIPRKEELENNPRSRSAKLRIAEKV
ncbi:MAG TPA: 16S rRNA (cytosine(1402)-N(4))-methyltransferase RsmH [Tissierellales bacterium]|nr:16S rRNA (cytosine(1402)-N(4))-methyltransferase RsmH [Tissierellales bacterium]